MTAKLRERFASLTQCVCQGARLMVGFPDYDAYVEHMRRNHPDRPVMTYPDVEGEHRPLTAGQPGGARPMPMIPHDAVGGLAPTLRPPRGAAP